MRLAPPVLALPQVPWSVQCGVMAYSNRTSSPFSPEPTDGVEVARIANVDSGAGNVPAHAGGAGVQAQVAVVKEAGRG